MFDENHPKTIDINSSANCKCRKGRMKCIECIMKTLTQGQLIRGKQITRDHIYGILINSLKYVKSQESTKKHSLNINQ